MGLGLGLGLGLEVESRYQQSSVLKEMVAPKVSITWIGCLPARGQGEGWGEGGGWGWG